MDRVPVNVPQDLPEHLPPVLVKVGLSCNAGKRARGQEGKKKLLGFATATTNNSGDIGYTTTAT